MSVPAQLAHIRRAKGMTAAALACRIGTHASNIYAIETGRRDPRSSTTGAAAHALGARVLVIDTQGRASARDIAESILLSENSTVRIQALVQLVANLQASDLLAKAALTIDPPPAISVEWDAAIAGTVEIELARAGLRTPAWAERATGNPVGRWDPWTAGRLAPDAEDVPEPLRRRGIWITADELASA